jgi:hypothetical protein
MCGEGCADGGDPVDVGAEAALGGDERSVAGDASQDVDGDACVGEPGQSGVPQAVAAQVCVAEFEDDVSSRWVASRRTAVEMRRVVR